MSQASSPAPQDKDVCINTNGKRFTLTLPASNRTIFIRDVAVGIVPIAGWDSGEFFMKNKPPPIPLPAHLHWVTDSMGATWLTHK